MRLRNIGEAVVCSPSGNAVSVRAAVLLSETAAGPGWSGEVRPYRPLALAPGRYTLRVRGEDLGALVIQTLHGDGEREVGDFQGVGPPSARLRDVVARGGSGSGRGTPFPRVAGEVEATQLAKVLTWLAGVARGVVPRPGRTAGRRR